MPAIHKGASASTNITTKIGSRANEKAPIIKTNKSHFQTVIYIKKLRKSVITTMGPEKIIPSTKTIAKQIRKTKVARRYVNISNGQRYFIFSKRGGHWFIGEP
jgi:ribonucleotide monophosphatase NagD (HAD superfamily)